MDLGSRHLLWLRTAHTSSAFTLLVIQQLISQTPQLPMDFSSHLLAIPGVLALVLLYWYNLWRLRDQSHKSKGKLAPEVPGTLPIIGHIHLLGAEKTLARSQ